MAHGLPVVSEAPWQQGGYRWRLNPCPWNPAHTNTSAFIVQLPNGAIAAGCHHNGCHGNNWHVLRQLYEPGWQSYTPPAILQVGSTNGTAQGVPWGTPSQPPVPLITTLADVQETTLEWLWWPYLPRAALVMVDGDPGTGKSLLTIQLAAILSRGWALPDQQGKPILQTGEPQHTLLMSAEDSVSATIKKRCRECGGDDSKIHLFTEWQSNDGAVHPF